MGQDFFIFLLLVGFTKQGNISWIYPTVSLFIQTTSNIFFLGSSLSPLLPLHPTSTGHPPLLGVNCHVCDSNWNQKDTERRSMIQWTDPTTLHLVSLAAATTTICVTELRMGMGVKRVKRNHFYYFFLWWSIREIFSSSQNKEIICRSRWIWNVC